MTREAWRQADSRFLHDLAAHDYKEACLTWVRVSLQSLLLTHLPLSSAGEPVDTEEVSLTFWSLINTYPLLSDGGINLQPLCFLCMCWVLGEKCFFPTAAPGNLILFALIEQVRLTQATPVGPNGGKWPGSVRRQKGMEGNEMDGNYHNFHGKSWAGQTRGKGRWEVKERQDSLEEGDTNSAKHYQVQVGENAAKTLLALAHSHHMEAFLSLHTLSSAKGWEMLLEAIWPCYSAVCLPWEEGAKSQEETANMLCPTSAPHSLCRSVPIMSPSSALCKEVKNKVVWNRHNVCTHWGNQRVHQLGILIFLCKVSKIFPTTIPLASAMSA